MYRFKNILLFCLMFLAGNSYAFTIDKLVIFGDSLTDTDGIYAYTNKIHQSNPIIPAIPASPPYVDGRFSNGPVWVEYVAKALHLDPKSPAQFANYAFGGSWAEPFINSGEVFPFGFDTIMDKYIKDAKDDTQKDKHLYIIWMGANDYLSGRLNAETATDNTVGDIEKEIYRLLNAGARHFLIIDLPDVGITPEVVAKGPKFVKEMNTLVQMHNRKLAAMVANLRIQRPEATYIYDEVYAQMDEIVGHPDKYNLKNVTQACYDGGILGVAARGEKEMQKLHAAGLDIRTNVALREAYLNGLSTGKFSVCANQDDYLFWDHVHPTTVGHQLLANAILDVMKKNDVTGPA